MANAAKKPLSKTARINLVRAAKKQAGTMKRPDMISYVRGMDSRVTAAEAGKIVTEANQAVKAKKK
jgi:hypothetical protein